MLSGGAASFSTGSSEKEFPVSIAASFLQELALCTYKDPDRPALQALTAALKILDQADNLEETQDRCRCHPQTDLAGHGAASAPGGRVRLLSSRP
jgi:hypothetical protein